MDGSIPNQPLGSERKRPYEYDLDLTDERHVRRRSDDYGYNSRRSRSPRHLKDADHRNYEQIGGGDIGRARRRHGDMRDDRYETGHREDPRQPSHYERSPRQHMGSRSRSPARHRHRHHHRDETHPSRHHHHHHHRHRFRHVSSTSHQDSPPALPSNARPLSRSADFDTFRPLFARYLDVQKQIDITTLDEREVRGRWKSFVGKWNKGELAEGWYQPETFEDALDQRGVENGPEGERRRDVSERATSYERPHGSSVGKIRHIHTIKLENDDERPWEREDAVLRSQGMEDEGEEDDEDYGPTLPGQDNPTHATSIAKSQSQTKPGPGIPTLSDLTLRRELEAADLQETRGLLRQERKGDRALQKERLDELTPRADAGTQARKLEKRREVRDANTSFANAKSSNDVPELADAELMGADGGGIEEYKKLKREAEHKKTEREVRREEVLRAKREEREERMKAYREREAHTVDMLREIAKSRFG
ncbi:hypothetical protein HD806DRAFT_494657 [Xylariaceae sp. AK1471]|nr:hypothetical protein HD806DRAFT_494657 [Xylariaceae sp. AK1471]